MIVHSGPLYAASEGFVAKVLGQVRRHCSTCLAATRGRAGRHGKSSRPGSGGKVMTPRRRGNQRVATGRHGPSAMAMTTGRQRDPNHNEQTLTQTARASRPSTNMTSLAHQQVSAPQTPSSHSPAHAAVDEANSTRCNTMSNNPNQTHMMCLVICDSIVAGRASTHQQDPQ